MPVWEIVGWNGSEEIFRRNVPIEGMGIDHLKALLLALTAKHSLDDAAIVDCYRDRDAKAHRVHLDVRESNDAAARTTIYTCGLGLNCWFVARARDEVGVNVE